MRRLVAAAFALPALLAFADALHFRAQNRNNGSLISSGVKREYLLYVPRSYDAARATPLVISMHGAGGWPVQQKDASRWNELAEREGFIVVYPSANHDSFLPVWRVERDERLTRDVRFISDLIDRLESQYNIDRDRIYANGLSNGGGMAFALSCTMPDRIAAVGLVASAQTLPFSWCSDRHAVPVIAFHGTADPIVPYNGGVTWISAGRSFPSLPLFMEKWARRNGCTSVRIKGEYREYTNCVDNATVALYTLREGGHVWPGGQPFPEWFAGPNVTRVDATRTMWSFFREHPLRAARSASAR